MSTLADAKPVVIIATRDRKTSMSWYRDTLGLKLLSEDPYAAVFALNGAIMRLSIIEDWTPHPHTVLGFEVSDIRTAIKALTAKGVKLLVYPGFGQSDDAVWTSPDGAAKVAWFNDPDGNNLSVTEFAR
ncbi:MAG: VOC family protein [Parvularculaceae bacterium]|nr:VOC family protein [Parvularculaceae bacterium]